MTLPCWRDFGSEEAHSLIRSHAAIAPGHAIDINPASNRFQGKYKSTSAVNDKGCIGRRAGNAGEKEIHGPPGAPPARTCGDSRVSSFPPETRLSPHVPLRAK